MGATSISGSIELASASDGVYTRIVGYNGHGNLQINLRGGSSVVNLSTDNRNERMRIDYTGNVSIGTTDSKGYKFAVAGSAIATSITVKTIGSWPDYAFQKVVPASFPSISKAYIDQNSHLPGMPSEQQVVKDGLDLREMTTLLTKKMKR